MIVVLINRGSQPPGKSEMPFSVIPVKTGIQEIREALDSRLRGSDNQEGFVRSWQLCGKAP